jgi:hypothetical protein
MRRVVGIEEVKMAMHIARVKLENGKRRAGGSDSESEFVPAVAEVSNWWLIHHGQVRWVLVKDCQQVMEKVTLRTQLSRRRDSLYTCENKK